MFGFGKALDVLRAGDAVRRPGWRPSIALVLEGESSQDDIPRALAQYVEEGAPLVIPRSFVTVSRAGLVTSWQPTHADLLAEDWDYVPDPDDREPHGAQQAEHWPQAVPASMWCTVDAKRAKVNSIIWSAEAKPEQLGLNCGHWVAMPADWQAPA